MRPRTDWLRNHLTRSRSVRFSTRGDPASRPQPPEPRREGRLDPGAVGAGAEPDGSGDGARSQAWRTVEDTGQFQPAAVEGSEVEPAGAGQACRTTHR